MSYTELKIAESNGDVVGFKEYRNSHGGASYAWSSLCQKHFGDSVLWLFDGDIWEKFDKLNFPPHIKAVLYFSYDYAFVKKEHLQQFVSDIRQFIAEYPPEENRICHLLTWADDIERDIIGTDALGVCLYATSVGEDFWEATEVKECCSECCDCEWKPYNINLESKHFSIYDEIEKESLEISETTTPPRL